MAVMAAPTAGTDLHVRQPGVWRFVRLKLRLLGNGMRGSGSRIALFILGIFGGLWAVLVGFSAFAAASVADGELRVTLSAFAGAGVVLAWVFLPLLFFGVDSTLDPARFALLPLRRRVLVTGMLAAACVGIPPVVTLLAASGSAVGAASDGGAGAMVVALLGAVIGLLLCIVASRAITSAFAGMLRSRRVRDLAMLLLAVLGVSCGPLQSGLIGLVSRGDTEQTASVARVLSFTPLGAPFVAYTDAIAGDWLLAVGRLAIGLAGVGLLLWWWAHTLEGAMVGGSTAGAGGRRSGAAAGGAVRALIPPPLRGLPMDRFTGLIAREIRYWLRHPRRRAGLISMLAVAVIVPFSFRLGGGSSDGETFLFPLSIGLAITGLFIGLLLANQFGNDAAAYATNLLIGVPARVELATRAVGLTVLTLPLLVLGGLAVAALTGGMGELVPAIGVGLAALGVSVGVGGVTSVLVPYAMPESMNPFAVSGGGATAKAMLSLVSMLVASALTAPVVIASFALPEGVRWTLLPVGVAWGVAGGWLGTIIGGAVLRRRAPEILQAVTPTR